MKGRQSNTPLRMEDHGSSVWVCYIYIAVKMTGWAEIGRIFEDRVQDILEERGVRRYE